MNIDNYIKLIDEKSEEISEENSSIDRTYYPSIDIDLFKSSRIRSINIENTYLFKDGIQVIKEIQVGYNLSGEKIYRKTEYYFGKNKK